MMSQPTIKRVAPLREHPKTRDVLSTCNPFFITKKVAPPDKRGAEKRLHLLREVIF